MGGREAGSSEEDGVREVQTRRTSRSRSTAAEDHTMRPRHVPLVVVLLGCALYGAAVSALDLVSTMDETTSQTVPAKAVTNSRPAAAKSVAATIEAPDTRSTP